MGTTNILDMNNRISALEKGEVLTASDIMMLDGTTSVEDALDEVASGLTNMTTLLPITLLSDTATQYQLQGDYSDYMFVAIILGWYNNATNDNMVVIPTNSWLSADYLLLYRHNEPSTQAYARIENRGNGYITALGTEGISISVVGYIHK